MVYLFAALIGLSSLLLTGCGHPSSPSADDRYRANLLSTVDMDAYRRVDDAQALVAQAAMSVEASMRDLAEVERATHPRAHLPPPPNAVRIGLGGLASVDWSGPVGPVVERLAKAGHYRVRTLGHPPAIPVLVQVHARNQPLADILRDLSFQAQQQATLVLYPKHRVIEVRYARG